MPFSSVNPNGNRKCFTRRDFARPVLVKTQYTPIGFDIEMPIVNSPILEPLAAMLASDQSFIHPETL
jgi:hypothetical protein